MASYNHFVGVGHLVRDPEQRYTPSGVAVAQGTLAINSRYQSNGETKEDVLFLDFVAWKDTGTNLCSFAKKGSSVLLHGRLKQETWTDKQTDSKRSKIVLVVGGFQMLDRKEASEEPAARPARQTRPASQAPAEPATDEDDNIPF